MRRYNKASLIKWAFQGLCINEFEGLEFEAKRPTDQKTGAEVLDRLSFGEGNSVGSAAAAQSNVLGFCYLLTLYLLDKSAPKFQSLENIA